MVANNSTKLAGGTVAPSPAPLSARIAPRSPPAENTAPAPVRTITAIAGLVLAAASACTNSPQVCGPMGFRLSGRLSVRRATGAAPSKAIV